MAAARQCFNRAIVAGRSFQIAVDIGGTFTDGVLLDEDDDRILVAKSLTTPGDPGEAVSTVVETLLALATPDASTKRDAGRTRRVVHGTTLVANTLVERRGARVALVLNRGTEDALDIRRELRYDIYDLAAEYPAALIAREDRFALSARLGPAGEVWRALDPAALHDVATRIEAGGYDAVAVCLLHSPVDDVHERAVGRVLEERLPGTSISLSSQVAREIGEYERMSTVAANAYVQPLVSRYLAALHERLATAGITGGLDVMLSNGAFTTAGLAARVPIRILESGPAGGVLSAVNCAACESIGKVLAFDMGGTTAKACVAVDGRPAITHVFEFGRVRRFKRDSGLPAAAPSIDLIEIGAGGGSLAAVNALGLLQVGPQSAGAEPGPACYDQGGVQATVTDADLVLGYLDPERFLGGRMTLSRTRAEAALREAGAPVGLDIEQTAWGIHDIVNENMAAAARTHIAEKGLDAREFTLVATGGAGPVHAVDVARRLRIRRILCPIASGVGSCLGFLAAPARADRTWSKVEPLAEFDCADFEQRMTTARASIVADLAACGLDASAVHWRLSAEVRYIGQGNTVQVAMANPATQPMAPDAIASGFEAEYERLFHKLVPGGEPEVVTWRVSGSSESSVRHFRLGNETTSMPGTGERRRIYRSDERRYQEVAVHPRQALAPGTRLEGPLIITEPESTLVVPCPATVRVLASGTVQVEL